MAFTSSPVQKPADYTCGTFVSFLDLEDSDITFVSTLNPIAKAFVPGYYHIDDSSEEARRIDDILHTVHHLVDVHDSELETMAREFADADVPLHDGYYLDQEAKLYDSLHVPAQKPKGCTDTRKRRSREGRARR